MSTTLTVELEIVEFDVVHAFIVEWVLELILNVVQGDQDELTHQNDKIGNPGSLVRAHSVDDGWGIDQRKDIDEDQAIGLQADRGAMRVDGVHILNGLMEIFHDSKQPLLGFWGDCFLFRIDILIKILHTGVNTRGIIFIVFEMEHQGVAQVDHKLRGLRLVLLCQFYVCHQEVREGLQGASEFTQMLQSFLTPSERSANGENQRENDCDADQGEVHVEFDVVSKRQIGHYECDDHGDPGSIIDDDQVLFHFSLR